MKKPPAFRQTSPATTQIFGRAALGMTMSLRSSAPIPPPLPPEDDDPSSPMFLPAPGALRSVFSGAPVAPRSSLRAQRDLRRAQEAEPHLDAILYGSHDVSTSRLARRRVMTSSALGREVRDFLGSPSPRLGYPPPGGATFGGAEWQGFESSRISL